MKKDIISSIENNSGIFKTMQNTVEPKESKEIDRNNSCWFCATKEQPLLFSCEFDTPVHKKCIEEALKEDPTHPEALIMAKEFKMIKD